MFKASRIIELLPAIMLFLCSIITGYLAFVIDKTFIVVSIILLIISIILFYMTHKVLTGGLRKIYIKNECLVIEFTIDSTEQKLIRKIEDILKIDYKLTDGLLHICITDKDNNNSDISFNVFDKQSYYYACNIIDIVKNKVLNKPYKHLQIMQKILDNFMFILLLIAILFILAVLITSSKLLFML